MNTFKMSLNQSEKLGDFFVADCFYKSADFLVNNILPEIRKNNEKILGRRSLSTNDYWYRMLIPAFYLYRHTLELYMKKLASTLDMEVKGHDVHKIWKEISNELEISEISEVENAMGVLSKYEILEDEQLFRYETHNRGQRLSELSSIKEEDFNMLARACDKVWRLYLSEKHMKGNYYCSTESK